MELGPVGGKRPIAWLATVCLVLAGALCEEIWALPHDPFVGDGGRQPGPWISDRLPGAVRQKLESAIVLAEERIHRHPSCACLFSELGKDGVEVIRRTLYFPADIRMERQLCWRAYAFTKVGIRPTWICRKLWLLSVESIALVLLHEAMHHAGLGEETNGELAPHSLMTTHRVAVACGF